MRRIIKRYSCLIILTLSFFFIISCSNDSPPAPETDNLLESLQALPGIEISEIEPQHQYCQRQFQIDIIQPLNHSNPSGETFRQRLYLSHVNDSAPVVFFPSGYWVRATTLYELTEMLNCNQIAVAHRFYDDAIPDNLDWQYLTIEQAAKDHHRVVELFKQIYQNVWISTGRSKSGMSALFHRRFYPDDVQATVAYAAPLPQQNHDPRYMTWLNAQGTLDCQQKTKELQRLLLEDRGEMLPLLNNYFTGMGTSPCCGLNIVFEWLVTEYRYTFWQQQDPDCQAIPDSNSTIQEMFNHLLQICWHASSYADNRTVTAEAYHYQLLTEFGDIVYDCEHLMDLLNDTDGSTVALLAPEGADLTFNPAVMPDIINWLQTSGNNIIYLYGGMDYNTAVGIELNGGTNALKIIEPAADHGILISELSDYQQVITTLESWLGIDISQ